MFFLNEKTYNNIQRFIISLVPVSLISGPALPDILISLSSIFFIAFVLLKKKFQFQFDKISIILLIWCLYNILISFLSEFQMNSLEASLFYFRFILFGFIISQQIRADDKIINYIFLSFVLSFLIVNISLNIEYIYDLYNNGFNSLKRRYSGIFLSELKMGSFLIRLLPLFVGLYFFQDYFKNYFFKIFFILLILNSCFAILISGERFALYMLIILLPFLIFNLINSYTYRLFTISFILLIFILLIFSMPKSKERLIDETIKSFNLKNLNNFFNSKSNERLIFFSTEHEDIYKMSYIIFSNNLNGIGIKNFRKYCSQEKYQNIMQPKHPSRTGCSTHPHNYLIQFFVSGGILGGVFYIILFIIFAKEFINQIFLRKKQNNNYSYFYLSGFIALFFLAPSGSFFNNWISVINFLCFGFCLFAYYDSNKKIN